MTKPLSQAKLAVMNKLNHHSISALILVMFFSLPAFAKEKAKSQPSHTKEEAAESVMTSDSGSSKRGMSFGLGLATTQNLVSSATLVLAGSTTALSGLLDIGGGNVVQANVGIGSTSGGFSFGVSGFFKHTLFGGKSAGFHAGGGLGLGTMGSGSSLASVASATAATTSKTVFVVGLAGLAGVHAMFPGSDDVLLSVDGGPLLTIVDGSANFMMGGLSSALGFSVHYLF